MSTTQGKTGNFLFLEFDFFFRRFQFLQFGEVDEPEVRLEVSRGLQVDLDVFFWLGIWVCVGVCVCVKGDAGGFL